LKDCLLHNKFTININDIRLWCSKYTNNFKLHVYSAEYLYVAFFDNNNVEYLDLALSCINKAIALFTPEYNEIISLNDLYMSVSEIYLKQQKYELAKEYVKKNNIHGCEILLAKCDLALQNYDRALESASEIYLISTSNIINASYIQTMTLLKNKKIQEAYDVINWAMSFINSIKNNDEFFEGILYPFIYLKAAIEQLLNINSKETIEILRSINLNSINLSTTSETRSVKHYYGKSDTILSSNTNIENTLKEIINQTSKKDVHYQSLINIYNEIFGGDTNE
jgi:tetratricopeptide (TPR) repeat protein